MNEYIKHVKGNTYYIPGRTNVGLIKQEDSVILIDTGNDKEAGRKIRKNLDELNLNVKYIVNTHSNADHIGANAYLLNQYNVKAYSNMREVALTEYPDLESTILYGGKPCKEMKNKFLMAKPSLMFDITTLDDNELEYFELKGHFLDMIGYKTKDNVYFIGDSLFSIEVVEKYHLFYVFDVQGYLDTLDFLESLNNKENIFIASHVPLSNDISKEIKVNRDKVYEVINLILNICKTAKGIDQITKEFFDYFNLELNLDQHLLVGSSIKNYLSYLKDCNKIEFIIEDNYFKYKSII